MTLAERQNLKKKSLCHTLHWVADVKSGSSLIHEAPGSQRLVEDRVTPLVLKQIGRLGNVYSTFLSKTDVTLTGSNP